MLFRVQRINELLLHVLQSSCVVTCWFRHLLEFLLLRPREENHNFLNFVAQLFCCWTRILADSCVVLLLGVCPWWHCWLVFVGIPRQNLTSYCPPHCDNRHLPLQEEETKKESFASAEQRRSVCFELCKKCTLLVQAWARFLRSVIGLGGNKHGIIFAACGENEVHFHAELTLVPSFSCGWINVLIISYHLPRQCLAHSEHALRRNSSRWGLQMCAANFPFLGQKSRNCFGEFRTKISRCSGQKNKEWHS